MLGGFLLSSSESCSRALPPGTVPCLNAHAHHRATSYPWREADRSTHLVYLPTGSNTTHSISNLSRPSKTSSGRDASWLSSRSLSSAGTHGKIYPHQEKKGGHAQHSRTVFSAAGVTRHDEVVPSRVAVGIKEHKSANNRC